MSLLEQPSSDQSFCLTMRVYSRGGKGKGEARNGEWGMGVKSFTVMVEQQFVELVLCVKLQQHRVSEWLVKQGQ